jgi:hypothetical protein
MDIIRRSLRSDIGMGNASMMSNLSGMPGEASYDVPASYDAAASYDVAASASFSQMPQYAGAPQEVPLSSNPWGGGGNRGGRGHRGRLFDLVGDEDAEEDQGMNNILPGMLDSLNINMFGGSNTNDEVDIEAISLMGIGLNGGRSGSYHTS